VAFDFRTIAGDDVAAILDEVTAHARSLESEMQGEHAEASVEVRVAAQVPSLDSSPDGEAYRLAVDLGGQPSEDRVTYGTEAGQFAGAGIDAVVCGPGDIAQAHAADEYIELEQVSACEQLLDRLLTRLTA
jgi:acetylornithine deacetylase